MQETLIYLMCGWAEGELLRGMRLAFGHALALTLIPV